MDDRPGMCILWTLKTLLYVVECAWTGPTHHMNCFQIIIEVKNAVAVSLVSVVTKTLLYMGA